PCVQQRCGISGIYLLNRGGARKLVAPAADGSAHPDGRVFEIANADRGVREFGRRRGRRLDTPSLRVAGRALRYGPYGMGCRGLVPESVRPAIARHALRNRPSRPLRLTVLQLRALLAATHRRCLLLPAATWVGSRLARVPYVRAGKRHRKAPAGRITTPEA